MFCNTNKDLRKEIDGLKKNGGEIKNLRNVNATLKTERDKFKAESEKANEERGQMKMELDSAWAKNGVLKLDAHNAEEARKAAIAEKEQ